MLIKTIKNYTRMKYSIKITKIVFSLTIVVITAFFTSCESYLDKKGDESMTFEKIWTNRTYIEKYYGDVWSYVLKDDDFLYGHPFIGASDDVMLKYTNKGYILMNMGTWGPSSVPNSSTMWPQFYKGIREANIFLANVDSCSDTQVSVDDIKHWKADIRFVRAYMYFCLYRTYGPSVLLGDELVDITSKNYSYERSSLEECEAYIESELNDIVEDLPLSILQSDVQNFGKPTRGTCLALIGRLKLYAARPLYNGCDLYKNVQNKDGKKLFPQSYDQGKWIAAAAANKALITLSEVNSNLYSLITNTNPALAYQKVFVDDWNSELIFARYNSRAYAQRFFTPAVVGGLCYGASGPTQSMVDSYAMSNGRYPITGYHSNGTPIIDPASGYSENGFSTYTHPIDGTKGALNTYNMYVNREPRFYASVVWSGDWWPYTGANHLVCFAHGGNSGPIPTRHDYPLSGYLNRKFVNPSVNTSAGSWGTITWPVIRLAEIYLNYAEALNEYDPSNADIYTYLNKVRTRAGLPNIETVYPEVANGANQEKMRELIHRERQVELYFEGHRYFDTRQWMIATTVNNGPVYGMDVNAVTKDANVTPSDYWVRTVIETRVFTKKHYLFPISQTEISKNPNLVQNYGW